MKQVIYICERAWIGLEVDLERLVSDLVGVLSLNQRKGAPNLRAPFNDICQGQIYCGHVFSQFFTSLGLYPPPSGGG